MLLKEFVFHKTVYLSDTNAEGNTYFARYFEWQGYAREEFYKQHFPMETWRSGIRLITVDARMTYKKQTFLFDELLISVHVTNLKKMSLMLRFNFIMKSTGEIIAYGSQRIAFADSLGKLIPIPEDIKHNSEYFLADTKII